jgi:CubicO group peptidase (beta-lactamase class C family)
MINFIWTLGTMCSDVQTDEKRWDWVNPIVCEALEELNVPGVAVGIVVDGKAVFVRGYGVRDKARNLPVTEETVFSVGSCTKGFTCLLIDQLVSEGKLAWDDPVVKHLPEFQLSDPVLASKITIRDLAAHRTGLPNISIPGKRVSSAILQKYEGRYHDAVFGVMEIALENDQLIATLGRMKVPLLLRENNHFEAEFPELLMYRLSPLVEFSFPSPDELHVPFEHFRMGKPVVFRRVQ